MKSLQEKVDKSREVIQKAIDDYGEGVWIPWTGGKDSTVVLHMVRDMHDGKVPFKLLFNDSTVEFDEVLDFIRKYEKDWDLDLVWLKHLPEDIEAYEQARDTEEGMEVMRLAKVNAINYALAKYDIKAFLSGIRWDEHEARSDEEYFSERPSHMRVHPILHFTIDDIWEYINEYDVPYVDLYDKGYKSLGEKPFTNPVADKSAAERSGREATKEKTMKRLRNLGYW